jgi:hypothetical protein
MCNNNKLFSIKHSKENVIAIKNENI